LGGTSGQVLAKNSNTDMDFVWVAQDDSNAIQNAIVDAKGDLIGATADNTPARLAVGANGTMLVANSVETTGLKWTTPTDQFPWTTYTPSLNNMTLGNGGTTARYQQIGKTVFVYFQFQLGSTSAIAANPNISLPVSSNAGNRFTGTCTYLDSGTILNAGSVELFAGTAFFLVSTTNTTYLTPANNLSATVPFTWTTNDEITAYFWYEVA
jgi:hypothetical protein